MDAEWMGPPPPPAAAPPPQGGMKTAGPRGRGAAANSPNRFERLVLPPEQEREEFGDGWGDPEDERHLPTTVFQDHSRQILSKNNSPDLPFDFSLNPYRGCEHGCIYCYARPSHEYLGFSSGLDFESKIVVKPDAAALLEQTFRSPAWVPQAVALSGNTDCYQPLEKRLGLTRQCLEVFLEYRNPAVVITKSALVLRDLDILERMARLNLVQVTLSVTTLDPHLARTMEPRAATPGLRLEAIARLAAAGIPTNVNVAPVIPGLTDHEIPAILSEAAARGATSAAFIMLRLPHALGSLFEDWLKRHFPDRANKVMHAVRDVRGGKLSNSEFGRRMRGEGPRAEAIARLFELHRARLGLDPKRLTLSTDAFRGTGPAQGDLFAQG